jgi:hypothetical protein
MYRKGTQYRIRQVFGAISGAYRCLKVPLALPSCLVARFLEVNFGGLALRLADSWAQNGSRCLDTMSSAAYTM